MWIEKGMEGGREEKEKEQEEEREERGGEVKEKLSYFQVNQNFCSS